MANLTLLAFIASSMLAAQTVQFEEASLKLSPPRSGEAAQPRFSITPGRVALSNVGLKFLVGSAYRISDSRISGCEAWATSTRYDLDAVYPPERPRDQIHEMIKALLIERIGLEAHIVHKETQGYVLVVDRRGTKLKPVENEVPGEGRGSNGHITGKAIGTADLANLISRRLGLPVIDMTQMKGSYDIELRWADERARPDLSSEPGPSIFTALAEQLGLQLRSQKAMLDYLVIDKATRVPTEP
jgi:uncharacterized protein (TIGR03435 family)